jgi:hypothetical protein
MMIPFDFIIWFFNSQLMHLKEVHQELDVWSSKHSIAFTFLQMNITIAPMDITIASAHALLSISLLIMIFIGFSLNTTSNDHEGLIDSLQKEDKWAGEAKWMIERTMAEWTDEEKAMLENTRRIAMSRQRARQAEMLARYIQNQEELRTKTQWTEEEKARLELLKEERRQAVVRANQWFAQVLVKKPTSKKNTSLQKTKTIPRTAKRGKTT